MAYTGSIILSAGGDNHLREPVTTTLYMTEPGSWAAVETLSNRPVDYTGGLT